MSAQDSESIAKTEESCRIHQEEASQDQNPISDYFSNPTYHQAYNLRSTRPAGLPQGQTAEGFLASQHNNPYTQPAPNDIFDPIFDVFGRRSPSRQPFLTSIPAQSYDFDPTCLVPGYMLQGYTTENLSGTSHFSDPSATAASHPKAQLSHTGAESLDAQAQPQDAVGSSGAGSALSRLSSSISQIFKGRRKGKGGRKRLPEPEDEEGRQRLAKKRKVDAEKQRKCRRGKANDREAFEAEIQRLRRIIENLGVVADEMVE